ncbi:hypothetical protein Cgig2_008578 [Carnegiea gigantea]|uniref:DUF4283 domain-containing protein n=1 Tax=Carnegiea gigantea TaxID=171969 RepID=A0A9Q1JN51_9CARY|nr:hypothetical protein Cgig2_008578 [Carnegiea gigantea]
MLYQRLIIGTRLSCAESWGLILGVVAARKGLYLVRFHSLEDKEAVLQKGIYYFNGKPFIIKAWNKELELDKSSINSLPIWVQFPDLDVKYWGPDSLSKLGSLLGIYLKTDRHTRDKMFLNYARVMIDIALDGPYPEYVEYPVKYEWKPLKCSHCNMYGRLEAECRKKHERRKEWRVVENQRPENEQR